jgi:hypothetical protein
MSEYALLELFVGFCGGFLLAAGLAGGIHYLKGGR